MVRFLLLLCITIGCLLLLRPPTARAPTVSPPSTMSAVIPASVTRAPIIVSSTCSNRFEAHDLPHITTTADNVIRAFAANGAGLAVNDLDNDGDLDLVLGAETGPNHLLWNDGNLTFTTTTLGIGPTRAVTVIDVDADGQRDVIVTSNRGSLNYWHNDGNRAFSRHVLPGVAAPAYTLNWGDLDRDGDLDLVTASYDAGFLTDIGNEYLLDDRAGVYVYDYVYGNGKKTFHPTRLATEAQALALALWDFDDDGRLDIIVGNDFAVPDYLWRNTARGWEQTSPFERTAYSTMSLETGDIDNDGQSELLAADMNPYDIGPATLAQWLPVISRMEEGSRLVNDPQVMTNALQMQQQGSWREMATDRGIGATGWSWTSRFGDLDNDSHLDLYVVNGMIEAGTFAHLPNHELVEENQALRNDGHGYFSPMPTWGLGSNRSGRSMVMADLDGDGDLDIVINNLRAPAQLFENQLCGGRSIEVQLQWRSVQNRDAIGARVTLQSSLGPVTREVRAASGYLSGDAPLLHFGLPTGETVTQLEVLWPDGAQSIVMELALDEKITVVRE